MPFIRAALCKPWGSFAALLILVSLPIGRAQARTNMPRAERHEIRHEIEQLEHAWRDAILHRNVQAMDALLSDDYTAITANGTLQSKEQALQNMRDGAIHFDSIQISDSKVRFYGNTALVTSRAEVNGKSPDGAISGSFRYTRVYIRDTRGNWKIVSFEASPIRDAMERK